MRAYRERYAVRNALEAALVRDLRLIGEHGPVAAPIVGTALYELLAYHAGQWRSAGATTAPAIIRAIADAALAQQPTEE
jgi:hypothetical protein